MEVLLDFNPSLKVMGLRKPGRRLLTSPGREQKWDHFGFSFTFSLKSSALDHSATVPPCLVNLSDILTEQQLFYYRRVNNKEQLMETFIIEKVIYINQFKPQEE